MREELNGRVRLAAVGVALLLGPAKAGAQAPSADGGIPGLQGIDHVAIAVNDVGGAVAAYQRLGFEVVRTPEASAGVGVAAFVDLGDAYLHLVAPPQAGGAPQPYTFEGGLGQAWRVGDVEAAVTALAARGVDARRPPVAGPVLQGAAVPRPQPVSGTEIALVEIDEPERAAVLRGFAGLDPDGTEDPEDHPNGTVGLAYVTVAVRHADQPLERLGRWGLQPAETVEEARNARSVRVDLPRGALFLVTPRGGGGIADFLEERRAHSPPGEERLYEGGILAVGIAVADLDETVAFLDERGVPHVSMELPRFGRTEVVQGAPGWGLRLEFVEATTPGSQSVALPAPGASCAAAEGRP